MRINFYLCSDKKSEHRTVTKTGTATIRKGVFSENAYMGTGEAKSLVRELEAHMDEVYALRFFIPFRFRDLERNLICFRSRTSRL